MRNLKCCWIAAGFLFLSLAMAGEGKDSKGGFRFQEVREGALGIYQDGRPVLVYNHGIQGRPGVPDRYNRSSYVHPLYGLDGEVLTDDFPKDHYHHRGVFWAWPHVRVEGKDCSPWAVSGMYTRFEKWTCRKAETERAVLAMENGWYLGEEKVVHEEVRIVVHPAEGNCRPVDFELAWTATRKPVVLQGAEGKSYGGMTIRFAPRKETAITVPRGRTEKDLAVTRLPWADLTAKFEGAPGKSGIALFIDRGHPDYPPTWLTRHYGVLCVGWPGIKPDTLEPGKPVRCAYRLWIHRGDADVAALRREYESYINRKKDS